MVTSVLGVLSPASLTDVTVILAVAPLGKLARPFSQVGTARCAVPNPKGIASFSLGLRGTRYPR